MSSNDMSSNEKRLREPPVERFAAAEQMIDLHEVAEKLRQEEHPARDGHRQIAIHRYDGVTLVLFDFDAGGELRDHAAKGLVTIHAVDGAFIVRTPQQSYELSSGQLVVLKPEVLHSVQAREAGKMLLTVHLTDEAA